jgi:hypothetical protein
MGYRSFSQVARARTELDNQDLDQFSPSRLSRCPAASPTLAIGAKRFCWIMFQFWRNYRLTSRLAWSEQILPHKGTNAPNHCVLPRSCFSTMHSCHFNTTRKESKIAWSKRVWRGQLQCPGGRSCYVLSRRSSRRRVAKICDGLFLHRRVGVVFGILPRIALYHEASRTTMDGSIDLSQRSSLRNTSALQDSTTPQLLSRNYSGTRGSCRVYARPVHPRYRRSALRVSFVYPDTRGRCSHASEICRVLIDH